MTGRYPWIARAFGDNAITLWSWLLTLPFAVTVMAGYEFLRVGQSPYRAFFVALTVHVVLGGVLLAARVTVLRPGRRGIRSLTALLLFAGIGVVRPLLALWIAAQYGILVAPGDLVSRVTINVASSFVMLTLIAVVVDILREHGDVQRRLIAMRAAVERRRVDADRRVDELRVEFATTVARRIDTAIGTTENELAPTDAALLLRRISDDIVRPMSHELFRDAESVDAEGSIAPNGRPVESIETADPGRPVTFGDRFRRVASGLQPDPPIVITLVYLTLVFPHFLSTYGPAVAVIQTPVIGGIYLAGNAATYAIGSRIGSATWRVVSIVAAYTGVAVLAAVQNSAALSAFGFTAEFYWAEVASYPFVAMAIAVIRSVSAQLHADEDALAGSLRERVRQASLAQRNLADARLRMSHVLHSTVQAELVAASLGLRSEVGSIDASAVVAKTIAGVKRDLLARVQEKRLPARNGIEGILALWGTALDIEVDVADHVWALLDEDQARASAVADALSEGLTNAVRHSRGVTVALTIAHDCDEDAVVVELRSYGTITDARSGDSGIGLDTLRRTASRVSLHTVDEQVVLTVVVA